MSHLLDDPSPQVRLSLAQALAHSSLAPRAIMIALAEDQPEIACTVVALSPVLTDADLIDLAATGGPLLGGFVASRGGLSRSVAAALAEVGDEGAALILLENESASISSRSVSRIMPIDAEDEDFMYVDRSFAGVKDIFERRQQLLAGAYGWPMVVLFGREPAGLSSTGEADIRGWYDTIQAEREGKYRPAIERLVRIVAQACDCEEPASWSITWPSLWQESPKERAERQKSVAETDDTYITNGVLDPDEVATARYGSGEWSDQAPQLDLDARSRVREMETAEPPEPGDEEVTEAMRAVADGLAGHWDVAAIGAHADAAVCDVSPDRLDEVFAKYRETVNMSASELERWADTECSTLASKSRAPIRRNLRLLRKKKADWTAQDIRDASRTISFVARMKGAEQGEPARKGCPSKRDISLKNWAYDPGK